MQVRVLPGVLPREKGGSDDTSHRRGRHTPRTRSLPYLSGERLRLINGRSLVRFQPGGLPPSEPQNPPFLVPKLCLGTPVREASLRLAAGKQSFPTCVAKWSLATRKTN